MRCDDCPDLAFNDEQIEAIRRFDPDYKLRETCCMDRDALKEIEAARWDMHERRDAEMMKLREIEAAQPYRGPPRNRHERRAAAKQARA